MTDLAEVLSFSPLTISQAELGEVDFGRAFPGVLLAAVGVRIPGAVRSYPDWKTARQACLNLLSARKAGGGKTLLLMVVNDPDADLGLLAAEGLPLGLFFLRADSPKQIRANPYAPARLSVIADGVMIAPSHGAGSPNLLPC